MDFGEGVKTKIKSASVEAIITKADGTVINLGQVDFYHRNPIINFWFSIKKIFLKWKIKRILRRK